jgi:hypothetical protein
VTSYTLPSIMTQQSLVRGGQILEPDGCKRMHLWELCFSTSLRDQVVAISEETSYLSLRLPVDNIAGESRLWHGRAGKGEITWEPRGTQTPAVVPAHRVGQLNTQNSADNRHSTFPPHRLPDARRRCPPPRLVSLSSP